VHEICRRSDEIYEKGVKNDNEWRWREIDKTYR